MYKKVLFKFFFFNFSLIIIKMFRILYPFKVYLYIYKSQLYLLNLIKNWRK